MAAQWREREKEDSRTDRLAGEVRAPPGPPFHLSESKNKHIEALGSKNSKHFLNISGKTKLFLPTSKINLKIR